MTERSENIVFISDDDWWHNACLNSFGDQWYQYALGYKRAADILVTHISHNGTANLDTVIYPIVFNYRHYLELSMKIIIKDGFELLEVVESFPKHHKISKLWEMSRNIIEKVWENGGVDEDIEDVEKYIMEFSRYDEGSFTFRYPEDKKGNKNDRVGELRINIRHLFEVMQKISHCLEGALLGISAYLEQKREIEREYDNFY